MKVTVRNYIPGEYLPWSREEIGYDPRDFDPEWTWIVFVGDQMTALLLAEKMLNTLMLVRLLAAARKATDPGSRASWLRPLWKHVRDVCAHRKIAGFWTCMDNEREPERKLLGLLRDGRGAAAETRVRPATGVWVTGRF